MKRFTSIFVSKNQQSAWIVSPNQLIISFLQRGIAILIHLENFKVNNKVSKKNSPRKNSKVIKEKKEIDLINWLRRDVYTIYNVLEIVIIWTIADQMAGGWQKMWMGNADWFQKLSWNLSHLLTQIPNLENKKYCQMARIWCPKVLAMQLALEVCRML